MRRIPWVFLLPLILLAACGAGSDKDQIRDVAQDEFQALHERVPGDFCDGLTPAAQKAWARFFHKKGILGCLRAAYDLFAFGTTQFPPPEQVHITRIVVHGDTAELVAVGGSGEIRAAKADGRWLLDLRPPPSG